MYRRRLRKRDEIAFSFDSFLDVVANVCGIIIRLILVAWVGGRSYHALMSAQESSPGSPAASLPAPRAEEDPLSQEIQKTQREIEAARARLLAQLRDLDLTQQTRQTIQGKLAALDLERRKLTEQGQELERTGDQRERALRLATLSLEELGRRQQTLLEELKRVEALPAPKKELRFRTPVSRKVQADEVFFECRAGRVAFIDLPAFLQEVQGKLESRVEALRTSWTVDDVTRPVGAFRLRYVVERERDALEALGAAGKPRADQNFRYGVTEWVVEPLTAPRGELLGVAQTPGSEFRQIVDALDTSSVVTFWVYPDSFELFRGLRDYIYERGLEVAGRPLPEGAPDRRVAARVGVARAMIHQIAKARNRRSVQRTFGPGVR